MAIATGTKLGRYEVTGLLGVGGMGEVYRALDDRLEREVAIKVLPAKFGDDEVALARFRRESKAVAALSHPNIRSIYDIDSDGGQTFAVMELLEGETLEDALAGGPFPWQKAASVALDIARGLAEAHARGVVHRDIKPQNIFLDEEGVAKILDFGLARMETPGSDQGEGMTATITLHTQPGTIMGTVQYMSPEQVRGRPADERSDVFSFGCVLHEMLTGKKLFRRGSPAETMSAILNEEPPMPEASIPVELQRIVHHCLQKSPDRRFQSARDMPFALNGLLQFSGESSGVSEPKVASSSGASVAVTDEPPSVAVLPFVNMSSDEENEYFSDGLAEELITALSRIDGLKVASRTSAFAFKSKKQDIREIGEQLNVSSVLEGSVRKSGKRLRIRAQLVKVSDGYHLWSETFDRQMEDVFEVQDEIAENITRALRVVLTERAKKAIKRVPTENVEAYEYYLRGRQSCYQFQRRTLERARKLFARATQLDPNYASAFAGIADCCCILYEWYGSLEAHRQEGDEASLKALEIDPDDPQAHASRGFVLCTFRRFEEAYAEFDEALRLDPDLFEALYYYGRVCFSNGEYEKALDLYERASKVRPDDYQIPNHLRLTCVAMGRNEEASHWLGVCLTAAEKHLEVMPDDARALYFGAQALVGMGDRERGMEWCERAREAEPEEPIVLYNVACVYANAGEIERAIDCIDDSVTYGIGNTGWIQRDPDLDPLRDNPRFKSVLDRL